MAEGAALEMPCTGNCTVGSNPTPSAIYCLERIWRQSLTSASRQAKGLAVLDGEVAVPCNPQSATAGLNSLSRAARVE